MYSVVIGFTAWRLLLPGNRSQRQLLQGGLNIHKGICHLKFTIDRKFLLYILPILIGILAFTAGCGSGVEAEDNIDGSRYSQWEETAGKAESVETKAEKAQWTVLIYMAADNDLEATAWQDINKMEQIGSTDDVNVVVQWDNKGQYGFKGCHRLYINNNPNGEVGKITSKVVGNLSEINSADPIHLVDFIQWGMEKYPAEKYAVILWNHGAGWRKPTDDEKEKSQGICFDETSGISMSLEELREAFAQINQNYGQKLEFIGMDACLMGMVEVAYDMKDYGKYLTFSQASVYGLPYHYILGDLTADPRINGKRLAEITVSRFRQYWLEKGIEYFTTISAVDLSRIDSLVSAIDDFSGTVLNKQESVVENLVASAKETENIDKIFTDFKDLNSFLNNLKEKTQDEEIVEKADNVIGSLKQAVIYEAHGDQFSPNTSGMTIWIPDRDKLIKHYNDYLSMPFCSITRWDEMIGILSEIKSGSQNSEDI